MILCSSVVVIQLSCIKHVSDKLSFHHISHIISDHKPRSPEMKSGRCSAPCRPVSLFIVMAVRPQSLPCPLAVGVKGCLGGRSHTSNHNYSFLFVSIFPGKSNPYCEVTMGSQCHITKTIQDTLNPKWNSNCQFFIKDLEQDVLCITVFERDQFSPDGT